MAKINIAHVQEALNRIQRRIHRTPLLKSEFLNQQLGHELYFKAENLQKIGAFKARGAMNSLMSYLEEGPPPKQVVAHSSGNHAQAVAWASASLGIPSRIFMEKGSSSLKRQATLSYGAEIVLFDKRKDAEAAAEGEAKKDDVLFIPPFDKDEVIAGQGTACMEALQDLRELDAVFAPCGGGGLLSGTWISSRSLCPRAKVFGAEPLLANDAVRSLESGTIQVHAESPPTLADGARTLSVCPRTFSYLKQLDTIFEVKEEEIKYWVQWLAQLLKTRVEPTAVLGMAAAAQWLSKQDKKKRVLIILSGGNFDPELEKKVIDQNYLGTEPREFSSMGLTH